LIVNSLYSFHNLSIIFQISIFNKPTVNVDLNKLLNLIVRKRIDQSREKG